MLGFFCVRETVLELPRSESTIINHIILEFIVDVRHSSRSQVLAWGPSSNTMHLAGLGKTLKLSDVHSLFLNYSGSGSWPLFQSTFSRISGVFLYPSIII